MKKGGGQYQEAKVKYSTFSNLIRFTLWDLHLYRLSGFEILTVVIDL